MKWIIIKYNYFFAMIYSEVSFKGYHKSSQCSKLWTLFVLVGGWLTAPFVLTFLWFFKGTFCVLIHKNAGLLIFFFVNLWKHQLDIYRFPILYQKWNGFATKFLVYFIILKGLTKYLGKIYQYLVLRHFSFTFIYCFKVIIQQVITPMFKG